MKALAKPDLGLPATVDDHLVARLEDHARHAKGAYAEATTRAVRSDTAIYSAWCSDHGFTALPASPETLVAFVDAMAAARAPATVRRYCASIAHLHRAAGLESPTQAEIVKLALKRMAKGNGTRQHQAAPLNRPLVDKIMGAMGESLIDKRDRALISLAYDTLARRSEIVALDLGDLAFTDDGTGTALIRRTKVDQEGQGSVRFLAHDTVEAIQAWIRAAKLDEGALFRAVRLGDRINGRLDAGDVARIVKRRALAASVEAKLVKALSGHSSRVGAAQDLVAADLGVAEVMQAGGWKTPTMVARYTEHLQARRGAMAKLAAKQNRL